MAHVRTLIHTNSLEFRFICPRPFQDFDFNELEKATEYEGGYTENSPIIAHFWNIVHSLPLESKKKLLEFTTGTGRDSESIPIAFTFS